MSAVIFGFLNVARALVPVRIGLTLATVPLGASASGGDDLGSAVDTRGAKERRAQTLHRSRMGERRKQTLHSGSGPLFIAKSV